VNSCIRLASNVIGSLPSNDATKLGDEIHSSSIAHKMYKNYGRIRTVIEMGLSSRFHFSLISNKNKDKNDEQFNVNGHGLALS
jgi:hypothetical protein